MSTIRTDPHHPAVIIPADYAFVGIFYQGPDPVQTRAYARPNREHDDYRSTKEAFQGNWTTKTSCDICGTNFHHGAYFWHGPSNQAIHVGQDCAENMQLQTGTMAQARAAVNRTTRSTRELLEREARRTEFLARHVGLAEALTVEHETIRAIRGKFERYDTLTDRQVAAVVGIAGRMTHDASAQVLPARKIPVPAEEGVTVTGAVVSTKVRYYGEKPVPSMLVEDDRGFRVFGTIPQCLGTTETLKPKTRVRFIADLEQSGNDPHFGYFRYPRCAEEEVTTA